MINEIYRLQEKISGFLKAKVKTKKVKKEILYHEELLMDCLQNENAAL